MRIDSITAKMAAIAIIAAVCFIASIFVVALVEERRSQEAEAVQAIAEGWGSRETMVGPLLVFGEPYTGATLGNNAAALNTAPQTYLLPDTLKYETVLAPEMRSRGIFESAVYESVVKVSGTFSPEAIRLASRTGKSATFAVAITDTRGIAEQIDLTWNGKEYSFDPGAGIALRASSGIHATVPTQVSNEPVPFSFEVQLRGSEGISVAPLGEETTIAISGEWATPKFNGAFLPSEYTLTDDGFAASWRISSFGRSYPQEWEGNTVDFNQLYLSAAGVDLLVGVDAYDMVMRSVKYAILFIVITFAAFFLFDVLSGIRVHPIQYLLIGSSLSLFYLLLLSLAEQLGFGLAYLLATVMIAGLVGSYSAFVLKSKVRAIPIVALLVALYGYLYFVLQLEDLALLFGSLLLFALLALTMYLTRNIDWFALGQQTASER